MKQKMNVVFNESPPVLCLCENNNSPIDKHIIQLAVYRNAHASVLDHQMMICSYVC